MIKNTLAFFLIFSAAQSYAQAPGSLDFSFGNKGKVITSINTGEDKAMSGILQSDGKLLVAGFTVSSITGKDFLLLRYKSNGDLDSSFGTNGIVQSDLQTGSDDAAFGIDLQSDGKIVLAGYSDNGSNKNAAIVRYKSNGKVDSSFGTNGIVLSDYDNGKQDELMVVKVHALSGKIIVGGSSIISSTVSKPVVARYLSNGTIDSSFNTTGIRLLWITSLDYQYLYSVEDLVVQANGKISAVGWRDFPGMSWESDYWACRINSDGSMDNTFSSDGVSVYNGGFNGHDRAFSMLLKSNNNFLMAGGGYLTTLRYDFTIAEISANGSKGGFSAGVDWGGLLDDVAFGLAEDMNGDYILAGSSGTSSSKAFALCRIKSTGGLDSGFAVNGKTTTTFGSNAMSECFDVLVQSDNKILAIGYTGNNIAIARYLGDATPQLDSFKLILPSNLSQNQNYKNLIFDWSNAYGAVQYEFLIDTDPAFGNPQTLTSAVSNYSLNNLIPNTKYYWKVRSTDGNVWGKYSSTWSFNTNALENFSLISPANNAVNLDYSSLFFDWSDNVGATNYELQIDSNSLFTQPLIVFNAFSNYAASNLKPSKTYYWRVRAISDAYTGAWTAYRTFRTKNDPIGINTNSISDLIIYPNIVSKTLNIESTTKQSALQYTVYDQFGRKLFSGILQGQKTEIAADHLVNGVYYIQIDNYTAQVFVKE